MANIIYSCDQCDHCNVPNCQDGCSSDGDRPMIHMYTITASNEQIRDDSFATPLLCAHKDKYAFVWEIDHIAQA